MRKPKHKKRIGAKIIRHATGASGRKTLKVRLIAKLQFAGIQPMFKTPDDVEVYNEYEDSTSMLVTGDDLNDGDQVLVGDSTVDVVVVEAVDDSGAANDVITYNESLDYVEVDMTYFDSFEEFYDEEDNLQYDVSDCGSGVGIRG